MLVADALARRDPVRALEAGNALAAAPASTFADWLDAASAQKLARPASGPDPALLERIRNRATANASTAVCIMRAGCWRRKGTAATAAWLDRLPAELADAPNLRAEKADLAALRGDWPALRDLLAGGAWGPLGPDCLSFAFTARLAKSYGEIEIARLAWLQAIDEAKNSAAALRGFARLAAAWDWPDAMDDALTADIRRFPADSVAFERLTGDLRTRRKSRELVAVLAQWRAAPEGFERRQEDWALLSLLVEPATAPNEATKILATLHDKEPANAFYTTNHAFALWELKRYQEACTLIDGLSAAEKTFPPGRAPYLAVIYASAGRSDEARAALQRAPPTQLLLPEEAALLTEAGSILAGPRVAN